MRISKHLTGATMSIGLKDKLRGWIDDVKDKMFNVFGHDKTESTEKEDLYETRWVWYHSALVIELFIIIVLLWYIAYEG